tara:strand:+ start:1133 stop:1588 length:456 start_codon:yes stop_codon:yes gene_type:complete
MSLFLNIDPDDDHYWKNHPTYKKAEKNEDVGLDIPMQKSIIVPPKAVSFKIDLGIKLDANNGYMLVPRSSIIKTTIRMSNSIGIIDKKYRGKLIAAVDNISDREVFLQEGNCYFQIVSFNGKLPRYQLIDNLDYNTSRGDGGFGSTGASNS